MYVFKEEREINGVGFENGMEFWKTSCVAGLFSFEFLFDYV